MAIPRRVRTCRVRPAPRFGCESSQDCNRKGSVLRLALKNRRDRIVEWHPAKFDIDFLSGGAKVGRCCRQATIVLIQSNDRNRAAVREILSGQDRVAIHDLVGSNIANQPLQIGMGRTHLVVHAHIRQLIRRSIGVPFKNSEIKYFTS